MNDVKLSLVVPYKQRLDNLRVMFEALALQTMNKARFEVVVGAMEYSEEYLALCREFLDRITIVSVLSPRPFDIPVARNLGIRQACGEVIVQVDADSLFPPDGLENLYERYFSHGEDVCIVGQMIGYGNNNDGDVDSVEKRTYADYRAVLAELQNATEPRDMRFRAEHVIPWAFVWTGLVALARRTVLKHQLYFDETFVGWGVDDLEWGYRICASGTPILLKPDVWCINQPHIRNTGANRKTESGNYRRFLKKWPRPDVELAHAFGDVAANSYFPELESELARVCGGPERQLGVIRGRMQGVDAAAVGVLLDAGGRLVDPAESSSYDDAGRLEVWPLVGMALPYEDQTIEECRVRARVSRFSERYRAAIAAEVSRVSKRVVIEER